MARGFLYLVAIMAWASRKVLARQLSNTLDTELRGDALQEAPSRRGIPEIFDTNQTAEFTRDAFIQILKDAGVQISIDGNGNRIDRVFIERLWRTFKCEEVYLRE